MSVFVDKWTFCCSIRESFDLKPRITNLLDRMSVFIYVLALYLLEQLIAGN